MSNLYGPCKTFVRFYNIKYTDHVYFSNIFKFINYSVDKITGY